MASHDVAAGAVGTGLITLTASTVDTVTFGENLSSVLVVVLSSSPADVWATFDGSTPEVGGARSYFIPAGSAFDLAPRFDQGASTVKLISSGAAVVRVQRNS